MKSLKIGFYIFYVSLNENLVSYGKSQVERNTDCADPWKARKSR